MTQENINGAMQENVNDVNINLNENINDSESSEFSLFKHSHKKKHSLEIWAVKLRFLLIYENVLKTIATARSECTAKHENKASYNTDYIVPDLIDFFGDD